MLSERISLVLNLSTLQLLGPLACVDVTDAESQLLASLCAALGNRLAIAALLTQFHLPADALGKRALGVRIVRLRKKLLAAGAHEPTIKSIRASGYQLCVPLTVKAELGAGASLSSPRES